MHDPVAHKVVILAMVHYSQIEHPSVFDSSTHEFVILNAMAIVRDGDNPSLYHRTDWSHFFAG